MADSSETFRTMPLRALLPLVFIFLLQAAHSVGLSESLIASQGIAISANQSSSASPRPGTCCDNQHEAPEADCCHHCLCDKETPVDPLPDLPSSGSADSREFSPQLSWVSAEPELLQHLLGRVSPETHTHIPESRIARQSPVPLRFLHCSFQT